MKKPKKLLKILSVVLASITGFGVLCHAVLMTWVKVAKDNDVPLFIHNLFKTAFFNDSKEDQNINNFKSKTGGLMRGVCHPRPETEIIEKTDEANIEWFRFDLNGFSPFKLDENYNPIKVNGEYVPNDVFKGDLALIEYYKSFNKKILIITPGIDSMLEAIGEESVFLVGGEFSEKFLNYARECARFYANKLSHLVSAFQICNETEIPKWRGALTTEQITYFIGDVMMKEMHDICAANNCVIGFNQSMLGNYKLAHGLTKNYGQHFDFVGADLYCGCFEPFTKFMLINEAYVKYLYYVTRKPVIITEFGYIGHGESKTSKEKKQYLRDTFGEKFDSEKKIKDNFQEFIDLFDKISHENLAKLKIEEFEFQLTHTMTTDAERQAFLSKYAPYDTIEKMNANKYEFLKVYERVINLDKTCGLVKETRRTMLAGGYSDKAIKEAIKFFFENGKSHLYKTCDSSIGVIGYKHTEEGQAKYLKDFIERLSKKHYVCGFFVYQLMEDKYCYECCQENCPVETGWGLIRVKKGSTQYFDPNEVEIKSSFYAIKEAYTKLKTQN